MELWVRSQSKETLIKVNELYIDETIIKANYKGYYGGCDYRILGEYKTEERALEVLDEIQNILKPKYILESSSIKSDGDSWMENGMILQSYNANARIEEFSTYVYEMPKE